MGSEQSKQYRDTRKNKNIIGGVFGAAFGYLGLGKTYTDSEFLMSLDNKFNNFSLHAAEAASDPGGYIGRESSDFLSEYFWSFLNKPEIWMSVGAVVIGFLAAYFILKKLY